MGEEKKNAFMAWYDKNIVGSLENYGSGPLRGLIPGSLGAAVALSLWATSKGGENIPLDLIAVGIDATVAVMLVDAFRRGRDGT